MGGVRNIPHCLHIQVVIELETGIFIFFPGNLVAGTGR